MQKFNIFKVTTQGDVEGRTERVLGYCTGNKADIEAYFDDQKAYHLNLTEITVQHISPSDTSQRKRLISRKKELEKELDLIKKTL